MGYKRQVKRDRIEGMKNGEDIEIFLPFISQERRYGEKWNEDDFQTSKKKM